MIILSHLYHLNQYKYFIPSLLYNNDSLAEWSKALDLGYRERYKHSSLLGVGSNPTGVTFASHESVQTMDKKSLDT